MLEELLAGPNGGEEVTIDGRRTIKIETDTVFLVAAGRADLFAAKGEAGKEGRKYFFASIEQGGLVLGFDTGQTDGFALIAKGAGRTILKKVNKDLLTNIPAGAAGQEAMQPVAELMENWLFLMESAAIGSGKPVEYRMDSDRYALSGVLAYNTAVLAGFISRIAGQEAEETAEFETRNRRDALNMTTAIATLAGVAGKAGAKLGDTLDQTDDPLLAACRLVGEKLKITVVPPKDKDYAQNKNPLGEIARASQIRYRQVALAGEWQQSDCGPLLGFKQDGSPVALLPASPTAYKMHDPADKTTVKVDAAVKSRLQSYAYVFYRPFAKTSIKLADIVKFGLEAGIKRDIARLLGTGLAGGLLGIVSPLVAGYLFDSVIPDADKTRFWQMMFLLLTVSASMVMYQIARSLALLRLESRLDTAVQGAVWDRLLSLPAPFFRKYNAGELAIKSMNISAIRSALSGVALNSFLAFFFSVFNLGLLFFYNSKIAFFALLMAVLCAAITLGLSLIQVRYQQQELEYSAKTSGLVLQLIQGIAKLRVAGAEKRAFHQWSKAFAAQRKMVFNSGLIQNMINAFNAVMFVLASVVIFYFVAHEPGMSIGSFIAFNSAFAIFLASMLSLLQVIPQVSTVIPLYKGMKPILEALPEYNEEKADPGELDGSIEVSHVTFRYASGGPVILHDLSLKVKRGEYLAVVGPSGSGKSTLLRLLLSFEKPANGKVYYSGHDLENTDIRAVRRQLGVVLQNSKLIAGDIYTNIVGAEPHLTIDDAWEAARLAGIDQEIQELPMGMHTIISEGAGTISGGQKQRILIARALVKKPRILFFDEATSALDNRTQALVKDSLDKLNVTRVIVAHRLSTITGCDRIIVMDKGRIAEEGDYEELMARNGIFAELAKRQLA